MKNGIFLRNVVAAAICLAGSITAFAQEAGVEIDGVTWATRNVDAPGTFAATPESAGMFYQWNRKVGWSATDPLVNSDGSTVWDYSTPTGDTWAAANDPCPAGWRVPTIEELQGLLNSGWEWTGTPVSGIIFGAGGNTIFVPIVSARGAGGNLFNWSGSTLWSNTKSEEDDEGASDLIMLATGPYIYHDLRILAVSVRCVKNSNDGVNDISADTENATVAGYYDLLGKKLNEEPTKGIYFILYDNGKAKKVTK